MSSGIDQTQSLPPVTSTVQWIDPRKVSVQAWAKAAVDVMVAKGDRESGHSFLPEFRFPETEHCAQRYTVEVDDLKFDQICLQAPGHEGECAPVVGPKPKPAPRRPSPTKRAPKVTPIPLEVESS